MQDERRDGIHQGTAEIDIAGLEDAIPLAFALAVAGVVAPADQSGTAEDLSRLGVVGRIADSRRQAGCLDKAQAFEFRPDLVRRLCDNSVRRFSSRVMCA